MSAAARIVVSVEFPIGRPVGVRGAVVALCRSVILRARVRIGELDGDRGAGRAASVDARDELRNIRFPTRGGARRAAAASGEVGCEIFGGERDACGHAVDHDPDLRAVRFAPESDPKMVSETVHRVVFSFSSSSKKVG